MTNCKRPRICKSYICIFVCLSTKAIHIELVTDLTAEAFIAAFKRFTSRRGKCSNLYSDNGTNFHGAHRLLTDMHKSLLKESFNHEIYSHLARDGTTWHFIPPSSPHFGGIWESNVKSIKHHLRRVIGETLLSFEELYTLLTQIEAILNSRPLCSISDADQNPLTPSHFLIGEPLTATPEPTISTKFSLKSSWNHIRNMAQGFWKRWSLEYITSLQHRTKWTTAQPNLTPGKLVVIKDPSIPPTKWMLGKIEEVYAGLDGCVRVVTVRTGKGTYKRPITKIALLPTSG
ncbi:PREDICTED: uncharacterized protein LOC108357009 [Rhagoletis zephyria]|uniref:uncharacterized protein LOC108357009 n=1 Tax=Rhagoletis zephyria TaxID=28612 RepID=UPI0008118BDC|nr:PREDICTED: uncharacterized protein LOC108357009 [Rhagoletis zephyria]